MNDRESDDCKTGFRSSRLERAVWKIQEAALAGHPTQSPAARARKFLATDRAANGAKDDDIRAELGDMADASLRLLATTPSRDAGDVAVKIAAALLEQDFPEGECETTIHVLLARALAELVILKDGPLPESTEIEDMKTADTGFDS